MSSPFSGATRVSPALPTRSKPPAQRSPPVANHPIEGHAPIRYLCGAQHPIFLSTSAWHGRCTADADQVKKAGPMGATTQLKYGDNSLTLPVKDGTIGPSVMDISKLYAQSGMFTYDPGFTSTASCESGITYIDGDKAALFYRGNPFVQLAEPATFLELCYLLPSAKLPPLTQKPTFD